MRRHDRHVPKDALMEARDVMLVKHLIGFLECCRERDLNRAPRLAGQSHRESGDRSP